MKQIIPEIYIKDCQKALSFYQELFGGEIKNLQLSDNMPMFRDLKGKVIHSELHVNHRCVFYFVDIFEKKRAIPGNVTLMLHMDDQNELKRCYDALSREGEISMELQKTFWGAWHAIVTDRFGAPWALNCAEDHPAVGLSPVSR